MIETVKGQKPSRDRKLHPLEYRLHMLSVKTAFAAIFEVCFGKMC